jgi:hypothetical protein
MGATKINENLDIKEIISKLRYIDILMQSTLFTKENKYLIKHNKANQIVLDSTSSQCSHASNNGELGEITISDF